MMGRSLELMGMASFNVFLGMVLTVTFLNQGGGNKPSRLSEESVSAFIQEMAEVAHGKKEGLDQYGITTWFMDHIDDNSLFTATVNIAQANGDENQQTLEMNRMNYISHILQEIKGVQERESHLNIEYVKINEDGRTASVIYTSIDKGRMPVADQGTGYTVPVTGMSYCEQKVALRNATMKVSGGNCTTNITVAESF